MASIGGDCPVLRNLEGGDIGLLKAANDWLNNVIPLGFTTPITLSQLVQLAIEWLGV